MIINWVDNSPEGKKRQELIEKILPKEPIVDSFLQPRLVESLNDTLIKALKQEIEVYKKYPKPGKYDEDTFDPRNNETCFMGQGFKQNGVGFEGWTDMELHTYRKRIGTIDHSEWGNVTLLEIWGGDHFVDYLEMVTGVFKYAWGKSKTMPEIQFHINPLFRNTRSGKAIVAPHQIETDKEREHLVKIAHYIEIRDRLKKAKENNPLNLGLTETDDPKPSKYSHRVDEDEDDEDDY